MKTRLLILCGLAVPLALGASTGAPTYSELQSTQQPAATVRSTEARFNPAALPEGTRVFRGLAYVANGHQRQKLDLYLPASGTNLPLVVWIHGGAWLGGSKDQCPALFLLKDRFAVASINYRLSQHAIFPAQLEDCKAAIRWLRAHAREYGIDPDRIGVWGASAGGHLAALLGTTGDVAEFDKGENLEVSSRVQAVCDWFGPTDFTQLSKFPSAIDHAAPESPPARLIGGPIQQNKDKVRRANPITYVTKDDPPFLIMHGDKDNVVPLNQSELLTDALNTAGVQVAFHVVTGAGHGFGDIESHQLVRDFFVRHLLETKQK